jgi:hypothetical protein
MIPITNETVTNEQSGIGKVFAFGVKAQNLHVIFDFLRNKCYADPVRAVVREYGTNAQDVHNRYGITTPIQITLPSKMESFFKVRDFGHALTDTQIGSIYTSYGESDKRTTDAETGSLGLGCKSGFAYGDSFLVNSYRKGKLTTWNAYIDPSKRGEMAKMMEDTTTEADGLEVIIPVKDIDIPNFRSKALQVFSHFVKEPQITNLTDDEKIRFAEMRNPKKEFSGEAWHFTGKGISYAVMANVAYPLDSAPFSPTEMGQEYRDLINKGVVLYFENGKLDFAISREDLQYTDITKKNILEKLKTVGDDLVKQAESRFAVSNTLWDARLVWLDVFRMDGQLYHLRNLFQRRSMFKGQSLNQPYFDIGNDMNITRYTLRSRYNNEIQVSRDSRINVTRQTMVIFNDNNLGNGIKNRIISYLMNKNGGTGQYSEVYVLSFLTNEAQTKWVAETGFDFPMPLMSTLPKETLSDYFGKDDSGRVASPKHSSREFQFVTPKNGWPKGSDYWEIVDVDLNTDAGVYLPIERFVPKRGHEDFTNSDLNYILLHLKEVGISIPTIYGFKPHSVERVTKTKPNPKMILFWTWLQETVEAHLISNQKLLNSFANYRKIQYTLDMNAFSNGLSQLMPVWKNIPTTSQLSKFFEKLSPMIASGNKKISALNTLLGYTKLDLKSHVTEDWKSEFQSLEGRYTLLFKVLKTVSSHHYSDKEWSRALEEYVVLIDTVTP